jgi:16S rRNA (uracil1498-N3)-methyltransferase
MVEPLFRFDAQQAPQVGELISLTGSEAKHAISVRRMRVGEAIQLSNGAGLRLRGTVQALTPNELVLQIAEVITESRPELEIHLAQALAKGDRDELAVQAATEIGLFGVIPWQADRSISRWEGQKIAKGVERWRLIAAEAAKQSLRAFEPMVSEPKSSSQLSHLFEEFSVALVLDPTSEVGLGDIEIPSSGRILLVVGPEGGISDAELCLFRAAGAKLVNIGSSILRTSTAGVAAMSGILALSGAWSKNSSN